MHPDVSVDRPAVVGSDRESEEVDADEGEEGEGGGDAAPTMVPDKLLRTP